MQDLHQGSQTAQPPARGRDNARADDGHRRRYRWDGSPGSPPAMESRPVLPQAGPSLGPDGLLTYLDEDGVRHVVALLPPVDEAS